MITLFFSLLVYICITIQDKSNTETSSDNILKADTCESTDDKINELEKEISTLKDIVSAQNLVLTQFNNSLNSYITSCEEQGFIYDYNDENMIGLTSASQHNSSFKMIQVLSGRLPKKDAVKFKFSRKGLPKKLPKISKKRWLHVIISLKDNGIFELYDEYQNKLFEFYDKTIMDKDNNIIPNNVIILKDSMSYVPTGDVWFAIARNDKSWVNLYSIAIFRNYQGNTIKHEYIDGHLSREQIIFRPNNETRTKLLNNNYSNNKSNANKNKKNKNKTKKTKVKDDETKTDKEDKPSEPKKEDKILENETTDNTSTNIENIDENDDVTVTGLCIYHKQRRKNIIISYSDGTIFAYKRDGIVISGFQSPNKTINLISRTLKKMEILYATNIGFQFLKIPRLKKTGVFCQFPKNTNVKYVEIDKVSESIVYFVTGNGKVLVYNTKRKSNKMCNIVDSFYVTNDHSPVQIDTIPGNLLLTSSEGIHIYNATWSTTSYKDPGLVLVRKFNQDIGETSKNYKSEVLISSHTDMYSKTVIAYGQSISNNNIQISKDDKFNLIILESQLPFSKARKDKGGIMGIFQKAPLLVGVLIFVFFFTFGKKGSPFSGLGKLFGAGGGGSSFGNSGRYSGYRSSPPNYQQSRNAKYASRQEARRFASDIRSGNLPRGPSNFAQSLSGKKKRNPGRYGF